MSLVGALNKIAKANKAGTAVVKTAPFYSAVDEALVNLARQKGTGDEFFRELSKIQGVKPAELTHRKLDKILQSKGKITKDEAIKLARENPPARLHEDVSQDLTDKQLTKMSDEIAQDFGYDSYYEMPHDLQRQADERLEAMGSKYGQYQLPGGANYREIKMKLPSFSEEDAMKMMELEANKRRTDPEFWKISGDAYSLRQLQEKKAAMGDPYLSSHWSGEPNVLAHMRVSDRTGPDGQKILHVEEVQSDWHQAGRSKGYRGDQQKTPYDDPAYVQARERAMELSNEFNRNSHRPAYQAEIAPMLEEARRVERAFTDRNNQIGQLIPDAPFKKNWHELAMKRLLNYAADNGYDSIALTPGAEQAKRYDLSKQISRVVYSPTTETLNAFDNSGKSVLMQSGVTPDRIEEYIGKEPAKRLLDVQNTKSYLRGGKEDPYHEITGEDLQVGGEGMKGFYDQMLPAYLNQYGKKYGAEVGTINPGILADTPKFNPDTGKDVYDEISLHHFPITPEMREEIANKGFPLYQKGGKVNIEQEYKLKKLRK